MIHFASKILDQGSTSFMNIYKRLRTGIWISSTKRATPKLHYCSLQLPPFSGLFPDTDVDTPSLLRREVKVSTDLQTLFNFWRRKMKESGSLSWKMITELYSLATQRIAKVALEDEQSVRQSSSLGEVLLIEKFFKESKILHWLMSHTKTAGEMQIELNKKEQYGIMTAVNAEL